MSKPALEKNYDPTQIEQSCYEMWESSGYFKPSMQGNAFCIMIPPPNVTGSLHMGHAFEATIMDTLTRYQRMQGKNTLWQAGSDHAGIATQMVVERNLKLENTSRLALGRKAFIDKVWEWKETSGNTITSQLRRMGGSLDWTRERFTLDEGLSKAVREVFIRLYDKGLIYRGKRLVNWDPVLHTAISDLEVVSEEEEGKLWHIKYPLADGSGSLVVATTRPETLLGDVCVAVNPEDTRYSKLVGQELQLPLTDKTIPVVADDYVDQEFGTGCVKITPGHDFNDYEVGKRHNFEPINIFTDNAELNDCVPLKYQGLDRFEARKLILKDLEDAGLLEKTQPHKMVVPRGDRSGAVIEPYLTDQWYVKVGPLAEPAIKAVEDGDIKFVPKQWENTYYAWMRDLDDWCISRQLWWGHQIPAWYDDAGNVYVGKDEDHVRKKYELPESVDLTQDADVLDTWFSSALWPFSTLGWPDKTPEFKAFYPTNVLVTGFDIIFFWVARMIMFGLEFTGKVPFHEVYIHGLIRDSEGKKMSKSKGNVLDPLDLIDGISAEDLVAKRTRGLMQPEMAEKIRKKTTKEFPEGIRGYGTDALRFTFASLASTGRNIQFDFNRLEGYRNFCNKLWNAARYILLNLEQQDEDFGDNAVAPSVADRWIHSLLQKTIQETRASLDTYRFDLAANTLHEFVWHEFCDWYLELAKPVLNDPEAKAVDKRGTCQNLIDVFETVLRLLHPIVPFITEEIWQKIAPYSRRQDLKTIMLCHYPVVEQNFIDEPAEAEVRWLKEVIVAIRNIRGELNVSPSKKINVLLEQGDDTDRERLDKNRDYLIALAKLTQIEFADAGSEAAATAIVGDMVVKVPLAGLIDVAAESARLEKAIKKQQTELEKSQKMLGNEKYIERAPAALVEQERAKAEAAEAAIAKLQAQLEELAALS